MKLITVVVLLGCVFSAFAIGTDEGAGDDLLPEGPRSAKVTIRGDTGLFLSLMRRSGRNTIEVAKFTVDADAIFDIVDHGNQFFSFIASNGKYLCRIFRSGRDVIEASMDTIDPRCLLTLAGASGRLVTIKADNDMFWSRNDSEEYDPIEANKSIPDVFSEFQIENV